MAEILKPCSVDGCNADAHWKFGGARGWCSKHYNRWLRHGDPLQTNRIDGATCTIDNCGKTQISKGLCSAHYTKLCRHGDPLFDRRDKENILWLMAHLDHQGDECILWPFSTSKAGYGRVSYLGKGRYAHRVMCLLAHGEPKSKKQDAAHSCGNTGCVNPNHLRWATSAENAADKLTHGTLARGETNGNVILSEADVRQIRSLNGVMPQRAIAKKFGVSQPTISAIIVRRNWGWLD